MAANRITMTPLYLVTGDDEDERQAKEKQSKDEKHGDPNG